MIAALLGVCLVAQAGGDGERVQRIRSELRAWSAAKRGDVASDDAGESHRIAVLRLWPPGEHGEAWLRDMEKLRTVFADCFVYPERFQSGLQELRGVQVQVPATYSASVPMPTTIAVHPRLRSEAVGNRTNQGRGIVIRTTPARLQAIMRPRRPTIAETLVSTLTRLALHTPAATAVAHIVASAQDKLDEELVERGLFFVIGVAQRHLNVDRDRLYIDGVGSGCRTVLRAATSAPDRFAAIVLREPLSVPQVAYDNLSGVPVLVLSSAKSDAAAGSVRRAVSAVWDGRCELRGSLDFGDDQVREWCGRRRRHLMRERVKLVMRPEGVVDGYWVGGISADLGTGDADRPASIEVLADKSRALITVNAWRIERFSLLLNDELIDLDRPFTLEVNGVAVTMRRGRSLSFLGQTVTDRFDPRFLFTTALSIDVPRRG